MPSMTEMMSTIRREDASIAPMVFTTCATTAPPSVATEVRSLAQKSAAAAREIKGLIGDSVDKVEAGGRLVTQAGATMQEVVASVQRVTDIMAEISAASLEQSAGIEQVNQAIAQMDQVTQQNAALVEEAAAAAESLQDQAGGLSTLVGTFRLPDAA